MQYIIHIQSGVGNIGYHLSVSDKSSLFEVIMMVEKNHDVKSYSITEISSFTTMPVDCLQKQFNWGIISEKFQGIDSQRKLLPRKESPKSAYWKFTNPINDEHVRYRFNHELNRLQVVKLLILAEPKFIASVNFDKINNFLLSTVEPWLENEDLDLFNVNPWIEAIM